MATLDNNSVKLSVSFAELELIKRALRLVENYGSYGDESPALRLLNDLGGDGEG